MPRDPYRTPARRERPPGQPRQALPATVVVGALVWVATIVRVLVARAHPEPPSRELVFAWVVLLVTPLAVARELRSRP